MAQLKLHKMVMMRAKDLREITQTMPELDVCSVALAPAALYAARPTTGLKGAVAPGSGGSTSRS